MSLEHRNNAANPQPVEVKKGEAPRIPMSIPIPLLSVPEIPGYHLHWFLGQARVERAMKAGYEFVEETETATNDKSVSGGENQDMGTRVSMLAGQDLDAQGNVQRLYLMKLRNEWWDEDQKALAAQSEKMLDALRVGQGGEKHPDGDYSHRYSGEQNKNVFKPVKALKPRSA